MKKEASGDIALMCFYPDVKIFGIDYLSNSLLRAAEYDDIVDTVINTSHA